VSLFDQLRARAEAGRPVRVGPIGAGKFGSMFLAQARRTPGLHVLGVADIAPDRAAAALARVGWPGEANAADPPPECGGRWRRLSLDRRSYLIKVRQCRSIPSPAFAVSPVQ
jgi:hypothetical protein